MDGKLKTYRSIDTQGKSQVELIIQVYDGAINSLKKAKSFYIEEKANEGFTEIENTRKFITHLYTTLDEEKGGDIARDLSKLYSFIINQTFIIQAVKKTSQIDDIINVLNNLKEGWFSIKEQQKNIEKESVNTASDSESAKTFTTVG